MRAPFIMGFALAGLCSLSACANMNMAECQSPRTPDQVLSCDNQRFVTTAVEGAATGALLGGIAGALLSNDRAAGALIGATLGGELGAAAGYQVASANFHQQRTEQNLQTLIGNARQDVATAQQAANAARQRADEAQTRIALLNAQYRAGQIGSQQYQSQLASYRSTADLTGQMIANIDKRTAEIRADAAQAGPGGGQLEQQATELDQAKKDLTQSRNTLMRVLAGA